MRSTRAASSSAGGGATLSESTPAIIVGAVDGKGKEEDWAAKEDADSGGMAKSGIDGNAKGSGNGGSGTSDGSDDGCCCSDIKD